MAKILIVDDSAAVLEATRLQLVAAGFEVVTQPRALGTLPLILKEQPDVILLDVTMPMLDGTKLCSMIKNEKCMGASGSIPLLLHSSLPETELLRLNQQFGADGFIHKNWPWPRKIEALKRWTS